MRILHYKDKDFAAQIATLNRFPDPSPAVEETVREIIHAVRRSGDTALLDYCEKFGGPRLRPDQLRVTEEEFRAARKSVAPSVRAALREARANVADFARRGLRKSWSGRNRQGARVGERFDPLQRVGIYVPGGTAPLISSAIMTVTLAAVARVPEIVVATPAGADGSVHPALLFALELAGATEVIRVGGAQAVAALAYGTPTVPPVLKIFGPGNAYVVEAKRQVFGRVAIDLLPGPSEVLVVADATANAAWIAADLLAQAEHGKGSQAGLITPSIRLLQKVEREIRRQAPLLTRGQHLLPVLENELFLVCTRTLDDAIALANQFAPEHLSLFTADSARDAARIRSAGAIFIGDWSPVAAGDYLAGPSHELPTGGAGKAFPGLTVDQFQRRTSLVHMDRRSLDRSAPLVDALSAVEGLDAHGRSATIRLETP